MEKVPTEGAHQKAGEELMEECHEWAYPRAGEYTEIKPRAWMVYGSTALGEANRRSDVDFMALFRRHSEEEVILGLIDLVCAVENRYNVVVEPSLHSIDDIIDGRHTIDPLFVEHLMQVEQDEHWSHGFPASTFFHSQHETESPERIRRVIRSYAVHKRQSFTNAIHSPEIRLKKLQRALELPDSFERKLARLFDSEGQGEVYQEVITSAKARHWLTHQDAEYSGLLELTIDGETPIETYRNWLHDIYPEAMRQALRLSIGVLAWLGYNKRALGVTETGSEVPEPPPEDINWDYYPE